MGGGFGERPGVCPVSGALPAQRETPHSRKALTKRTTLQREETSHAGRLQPLEFRQTARPYQSRCLSL